MKKLLTLILSVCLVTILTTGCKNSSSDIEAPDTQESTYENLVISDVSYDSDIKVLSFNSKNIGENTLTTGLAYTIETYDGNEFVETDLTDNLVVAEIALLIEPGQQIEEKIDLSVIKPLDDGYYRIKKEYLDGENTINMYIQFEVIGEDLINFETYSCI